jgi:hypothetical protein
MNDIAAPILLVFIADKLKLHVSELDERTESLQEVLTEEFLVSVMS